MLALARYMYKNDREADAKTIKTLETVIVKECATINKAIAGIVNDQKEMRREQRVMAVDIATMKVIKDLKRTE